MRKMDYEDKASWTLFIVCFLVYAIISMTKNAYSASIAAIVNEGIFTKAQAGIINSGFYLLYGGAQLLGVKLVDRVSPVLLISVATAGTALASVGMAFSNNFVAMLIIWSLCGLFQFAIWPAVIRILAEYLLPPHRKQAMVYIAFGYCIGMLSNYASAAAILEFFNWQTLFLINSVILLVTFVVWIVVAKKTSKILTVANASYKTRDYNQSVQETEDDSKPDIGLGKLLIKSGLMFLLIPSFVRCTLDLGVKSWVPTMIMENYGISASFATVLTTVLLVVNLSGVFITGFLYPKRIKNAVTALSVCFLTALPMMTLLLLTGKIHVAFVVLLLIIATTMMYTGNQLIIVIIPAFFAKYNRAGGVAGLLNAIASFGAVAANFGFGFLADRFGWSGTITSWIVLAVLAIAFCLIAAPVWGRFTKEE